MEEQTGEEPTDLQQLCIDAHARDKRMEAAFQVGQGLDRRLCWQLDIAGATVQHVFDAAKAGFQQRDGGNAGLLGAVVHVDAGRLVRLADWSLVRRQTGQTGSQTVCRRGYLQTGR